LNANLDAVETKPRSNAPTAALALSVGAILSSAFAAFPAKAASPSPAIYPFAGVGDPQTRRFDQEAASLGDDVVVVIISADSGADHPE